MNILPKKRWHVRTKDNIARVRRDEAEAQEQERKRQDKLQLAESEARINFLRKKSGLPEHQRDPTAKPNADATTSSETATNHVDLFIDYKSHIKTTNKELEKEKKEEQEKYEKQIGYLTYLGQDTNEALKLRSWYEIAPKRTEVGELEIVEKDQKVKFSHDPLTLIKALLPPEKTEHKKILTPKRTRSPDADEKTKTTDAEQRNAKIHKKEKTHKKDRKKHKKNKGKHKERKASRFAREEEDRVRKREKLEKLRMERMRREAHEQERQQALLAPKTTEKKETPTIPTPRIVQKYNSQFNPDLAKQNQL